MEGQADVKEELTEEDCSYEYRGAPSPEAPVYKLIPLQTISASSLKIKQEINSIVKNNNYLFNKGELEKRYTFLKKMMPNCQNDVPGVQSCDSNIGTVNLVQDKATQCTDDYVALSFRFMKDAWTETSTELENFYCENNGGMCTCNKPSERSSKVEATDDIQAHESEILTGFSPSQDSPTKN